MSSRNRLIVLVTTFFLVIASVSPAAAKKDHNPGEGPPPNVPVACDQAITLAGGGTVEFECLWSPADPGSDGNWAGRVGITARDQLGSLVELGSLVVFVRDSSPGDVCLLEQLSQPAGSLFEFDVPLVYGTDEYWAGNQESWCGRFDDGGGRDDLNGEPLHLSVNFRSKRNTSVDISLTVVELGT